MANAHCLAILRTFIAQVFDVQVRVLQAMILVTVFRIICQEAVTSIN